MTMKCDIIMHKLNIVRSEVNFNSLIYLLWTYCVWIIFNISRTLQHCCLQKNLINLTNTKKTTISKGKLIMSFIFILLGKTGLWRIWCPDCSYISRNIKTFFCADRFNMFLDSSPWVFYRKEYKFLAGSWFFS